MRRRGDLIIGGLVTALLAAGALLCPLPYVVLEPGPTVDTLGQAGGRPVVAVTGRDVSASAGQLRLTTVHVDTEVRLWDAVGFWFDGDRALVPRERVFPGGQSAEEAERRNAELFAASQASAVVVARREAGGPVTVAFGVEGIGGPSAGLMFTLGIVDKLTPADLTGGRVIAGTGTIDDTGVVGPVTGIPQKLVAARAAGARLFLVPAGNCAEAVRNAVPGMALARVATAAEALSALRTAAAGGAPQSC